MFMPPFAVHVAAGCVTGRHRRFLLVMWSALRLMHGRPLRNVPGCEESTGVSRTSHQALVIVIPVAILSSPRSIEGVERRT